MRIKDMYNMTDPHGAEPEWGILSKNNNHMRCGKMIYIGMAIVFIGLYITGYGLNNILGRNIKDNRGLSLEFRQVRGMEKTNNGKDIMFLVGVNEPK